MLSDLCCTNSATVISAGCDGQLIASSSGKLAPYGAIRDFNFTIHKRLLALSKYRRERVLMGKKSIEGEETEIPLAGIRTVFS